MDSSRNPHTRYAYAVRCTCDSRALIAATVIRDTHREEVARFVADQIREGHDVERVAISELGSLSHCECTEILQRPAALWAVTAEVFYIVQPERPTLDPSAALRVAEDHVAEAAGSERVRYQVLPVYNEMEIPTEWRHVLPYRSAEWDREGAEPTCAEILHSSPLSEGELQLHGQVDLTRQER